MSRSVVSERALVLAPKGRDAPIAVAVLQQAGIEARQCTSLPDLIAQLDVGAAFVVVTEEAFRTADLAPMDAWLSAQEEWADLPFVLLTNQGGGLERNPEAQRYLDVLGNVTFLERPFHPTTLVSLARSALRARRRQYEARARLVALRESEARFRNMADHAPNMTWVTDPSGYCTYLNRRWYEFTGQTPEQAEGFGWLDTTHPDDRSETERAFLKANAEHSPFRAEYRLRRADGAYRWAIDAAAPRFGPQDEFLGYVGSVIDIDDRKEAEEALRKSEERYRTLFEAIDVGFCIIDLKFDENLKPIDYRLSEINPAFERQTGLYGAEGRWVSDAVPGLERHWFDTYGRVALTGEAIRFENHAEPMGRWFDLHAFRTGVPEDRRVAVLFNDITARKNAENDLRELNATLEQRVAQRTAERDRAWTLSQDMLARADFTGMMSAVSPAWARVLGWSEAELLARPYAALIHPDDTGPTMAALVRMGETGQPARYENRIATLDGAWKPIEWTVAPEPDGVNFIAVGRDLSAAKEREAELAAAQDALRQSQKMEAVGQLTGGIAHDFNNLLAGISGSLEMLETRINQGRLDVVERYIGAAQSSARRAATLTQRLLAFSRRQTLDPKATDVNRLIAGMEDLIRRTVGPSITVEVVGAGGLWLTKVDTSQLENALLNLSINARDAMPNGGRITIETANKWLDGRAANERDLPPGQYISVCVTDTGTGMPPDVIAKAFDPFFTTKPIGQGTGLGLSMIHGFVRQSGGQIRVYSEIDEGTTMCLYFPRYVGVIDEIDTVSDADAEPMDAGQGETVLIIDDEPTVRMLMIEVLEEAGYRALEAADGPSGLKILHSDAKIDLLITDVGLPGGMNGRQVADAARISRPALKVLFVTGYAENAAVGNGHLDAGMAIVTKPFAMAEFGSKVRDIIESKP